MTPFLQKYRGYLGGIMKWDDLTVLWQRIGDQGADWYLRSMRAHANCIENLPVFGALVFIAYATDWRSPMFDALSAAEESYYEGLK